MAVCGQFERFRFFVVQRRSAKSHSAYTVHDYWRGFGGRVYTDPKKAEEGPFRVDPKRVKVLIRHLKRNVPEVKNASACNVADLKRSWGPW